MRINPEQITNWKVASKVRPIQAKPLNSIIVDKTIVDKFLLDTLEGKEPLGEDVMICLGEAGDVWQQTISKVLKKYKVISMDANGWMCCEPFPDNSVECVEVTGDYTAMGEFSIIGQWGETISGEKNIQRGVQGDFICRNLSDKSDIWIVKRKLFLNTYLILV